MEKLPRYAHCRGRPRIAFLAYIIVYTSNVNITLRHTYKREPADTHSSAALARKQRHNLSAPLPEPEER